MNYWQSGTSRSKGWCGMEKPRPQGGPGEAHEGARGRGAEGWSWQDHYQPLRH